MTNDDVIVCDPEAEYTALVQKFEGQVIKISPSGTQYVNPMDINANYSEEDNPIALKADFNPVSVRADCGWQGRIAAGRKGGHRPLRSSLHSQMVFEGTILSYEAMESVGDI